MSQTRLVLMLFVAGCAAKASTPVDVNQRPQSALTPLMIACRDGDSEAVKQFVARGADVNARGPKGETVLLIAVAEQRDDIVKYLIEHGADVNATTTWGMTPAMMALATRNDHVAQMLKAASAKTGFEASSEPPKHPDSLPEGLLRK